MTCASTEHQRPRKGRGHRTSIILRVPSLACACGLSVQSDIQIVAAWHIGRMLTETAPMDKAMTAASSTTTTLEKATMALAHRKNTFASSWISGGKHICKDQGFHTPSRKPCTIFLSIPIFVTEMGMGLRMPWAPIKLRMCQ